MKILFVHQNFPGQFLYLAPALKARGHACQVLTHKDNTHETDIPTLRYTHEITDPKPQETRLGRTFTQMTDRGVNVARAARTMRDKYNYVPDVIFGHSGWGEMLFLKEIWPEAKVLIYAEFYYRGVGRDVGFDPEFQINSFEQILISQSRAGYLAQSLLHADAGLSPTKWQASTHPPVLQSIIEVIFDGVKTDVMKPNPKASVTLANGQKFSAGDEVLTFVNRNLEPYRGYHSFMRALPAVMAARPKAQVVIVGGNEVSYGDPAPGGKSWKDIYLDEVKDKIDLNRVHFVGKIPYPAFVELMQVSRAHVYMTYPFVLSWSMLEAMSAEALIIGSRTQPVEELITHGENGLLVDFFDIEGWSKTIIEALAKPKKFMHLRKAARETIVQRYDLETICLPRMIEFVERHGPKT
ncbi:MAG: glycosyltransferase involved in cell wall biosynthesis [Pseudorhodobacter sp.]|jgi:glycosyltransferase involved in cell wall biosynthesis